MIWRSLLAFSLTLGLALGFILVTNGSRSDSDAAIPPVAGTRQVTLAIQGMT
jgi:hypothetical protein